MPNPFHCLYSLFRSYSYGALGSLAKREGHRHMRSAHYYQSAPERTIQILRESTIVVKVVARHRREATLRGRTEEAREMEALSSGVYRMGRELTRPYQLSNAA
jgi:hypothetical protein